MRLRDFFSPGAISFDLQATDKDALLGEMVRLLGMDPRASETLLRVLQRRESLGYGQSRTGVEFHAMDGKLVHHLFLIVAPPLEISNQYLLVLGRVAQFAKEPDIPARLSALSRPEDFFQLLEEKGV